MKRSEMINVIKESLKDINIPGYDDRLPDRILYFIETAGMLPPSTFIEVGDGQATHVKTTDGKYQGMAETNVWDEE